MILRDYQTEMVDAVFDYLLTKKGNPVVSAPGGVGKSLAMNAIIRKAVTEYPGTRVVSLVHDAKIISQNYESMLRFWPSAPVGVYSAGLKRRDTDCPILYCGIQSIAKRAKDFGKVNLVIVDECDMLSPVETTLYQKLVVAWQEVNPSLRVVGFTASPYRMGTGCLTELDLWDEVILDLTKGDRFLKFIDDGYLKPLITKKACVEADISQIAMKGGEFDEKEMQEVMDTDEINQAVVSECIKYGADRKHWLVFTSGVKQGHKIAKLFNSRGVPAIMLSGEDSMEVREKGEADYRSGVYRVLVNVGLYSRGWDMVDLDLIAIVRATQSTQWWVQALLRGTRKSETAENCVVLDFAGNTRRLGPVNAPLIPQPRRKGDAVKGEAPVKECPQCASYIHTRIMVCPDCGYIFPPPATIKKTASEDAILKTAESEEPRIVEYGVMGIRYKAAVTKHGSPYMRVTYSVGTHNFNELKFFSRSNDYSKNNLKTWWTFRGGKLPLPSSVEEALERADTELSVPSLIRVNMNKKYPEVIGCDFDVEPQIEDDGIPY